MKPYIDITARLKNKAFWLAIIPAVLLLVQAIAAPFGYVLDFEALGVQLTTIVNALFGVLAILGICVDTSTPGIADGTVEAYED